MSSAVAAAEAAVAAKVAAAATAKAAEATFVAERAPLAAEARRIDSLFIENKILFSRCICYFRRRCSNQRLRTRSRLA